LTIIFLTFLKKKRSPGSSEQGFVGVGERVIGGVVGVVGVVGVGGGVIGC
jgi:hypothetical protein